MSEIMMCSTAEHVKIFLWGTGSGVAALALAVLVLALWAERKGYGRPMR